MRIWKSHPLFIPTSFTLFMIGVIIVLFITLLALLIIRSDTLRIAITSNIIFVSFVRLFLVQLDMAPLIPLVMGMSMVCITVICNIVRGRYQPGWLYLLFLFLIGCFFGITIPFFLNLWFTAVLQYLSLELQGVVELVAGVLAPIAVGMNINELLNPDPSGSNGSTGPANTGAAGNANTGPAGNANTGGNGPTNTGAIGPTNTGSTGTANTGATANTNNAHNQVQRGVITDPLDIYDPEGKFNSPYDPNANNKLILHSIADTLQTRYDNRNSSGGNPCYISKHIFSPEQKRWISGYLLYHYYPEFSHRSNGGTLDFTGLNNTKSFRNKFRRFSS